VKEIKAYIQRDRVKQVVEALQREHAPGISIVEIHPVGYGYEPNYFAEQFEDPFKRYGYLRIVKFEVVCTDQDVGKFLNVIEQECRTGNHGDGMVFVSDVSDALRIRDGVHGENAL
jgi:nitrogen regulatory protein P-II 1